MITGILAVVLLLLSCLRLFRVRFFAKIHLPVGIALMLVTVLHIILTFAVWSSRPVSIMLTGFLALAFVAASFICGMRKQNKVHRILALCAFVLVLLHGASNIIGVISYQNQVSNTVIAGVDISDVPDGEYIGEYDVTYVHAGVLVTVESGRIVSVDILEHRNERGQPAERVTNDIVNQQRIEVDAVTGATNSSVVIMKAVENAITGERLR